MNLDHVLVLMGDDMIAIGPVQNRDAVVDEAEKTLRADGWDPKMDSAPDIVDVALVDDLGDIPEEWGHHEWTIVYKGDGLPGGKKFAVMPL